MRPSLNLPLKFVWTQGLATPITLIIRPVNPRSVR
jgi:hypothetical protein